MTALLSVRAWGATELVRNGSFEEKNGRGDGPAEWGLGPARWCSDEKGGHFARLIQEKPGEMPMLYREFDLPSGTAAVRFAAKFRVSGLVLGAQNWNDARVICKWKTADGGEPDAGPIYQNGDTRGWEARTQVFAAPANARKFVIMYALFQCKAGVFDLDDVSLVALTAEEAKNADQAARQAESSGKYNPPEKPLTAKDTLHVKGNKLLNSKGESVWLQGVGIPSMEWSVTGENIADSFGAAIEEWKVNCIRYEVRSDFWFGEGQDWNKQDDGGEGYRRTVDKWIDYANRRGVYVVFDLHEYKAPTARHVTFWKDAAARYKNRPGVLFDLLNEPHDISWKEWRDGGKLKGGHDSNPAENDRAQDVNESVGMQALVDAVRGTGAKNVLVIGGLDWAYDARGFLEGYALDDRGGNGCMVSVHCYPWKSNWQDMFLKAAAKYPLFIGEVGAQPFPMPWEEKAVDEYIWSPDMIGCIQQYKLHWTAFSFHPSASPCLIEDWTFKPTPGWGAFVKAALRGARISTGRMH